MAQGSQTMVTTVELLNHFGDDCQVLLLSLPYDADSSSLQIIV